MVNIISEFEDLEAHEEARERELGDVQWAPWYVLGSRAEGLEELESGEEPEEGTWRPNEDSALETRSEVRVFRVPGHV
jgi:hypothetical protein